MSLATFKGGIHPFDGKSLSKNKSISDILPGPILYYPLNQHIGAPAKCIVNSGDTVLVGQKIAEKGGFVSANIHSSVSGVVKGVQLHRNAMGDMVNCIVIENDNKYNSAPLIHNKQLKDMTKEDIINIVDEAGIVGMGGAGFPTSVKLSPKNPEKIEYVIVNCAECEPYLTSDYRKMMEEPDKLINGLLIILSLFDNAKGYLAVEDNKPECIKILKEKTKNIPEISVKTLKTKYPQGSERHLIYAVTGRKINSKMLPADAGCVVNNVDTVISVNNAVIEGQPLYERIVTVTGDAVKNPRNFRVRTGTLYSEVLEQAGGLKGDCEKLISGGPMMGFAMFDLDVPVTKSSSALLCFKKDEVSAKKQTACINCGRCTGACPSGLVPARLEQLAINGDFEAFVAENGMECVECGSCSYVCPAGKQLCQAIKTMRKEQLARNKKSK